FGGLRSVPAFAAVAVLIVAGIVGLVWYRVNQRRVESTSNKDLQAQQRSGPKTPAPKTPSIRSSAPFVPDSAVEGTGKPADGKRRKPKARPSFEIPDLPAVRDDLVSP